MRIFIDPGHGGSESGAVANGIIEKDINLTVSLKLKELLLKCGLDVKLSRESDTYIGLTERCNMANAWGADYFISVHHNAGGGDGYEVIHSVLAGSGKTLAESIGKEFNKLGQNCRRIFSRELPSSPGHDYYAVIRQTNMPAVITEYAFLDTTDVQAVDTVEELYSEATAIAKGFCAFLKVPYVDNTVPGLIVCGEVIDGVYVKDGTMYGPVRKIIEAAGCKIKWDDKTQIATVM